MPALSIERNKKTHCERAKRDNSSNNNNNRCDRPAGQSSHFKPGSLVLLGGGSSSGRSLARWAALGEEVEARLALARWAQQVTSLLLGRAR